MGNADSKQVGEFGGFDNENRSHFRLIELKKLHEQFASKMNAEGKISREQLSEALGLKAQIDADFLQRLLEVFDSDHCGKVDFNEFVSALSVLARGDIEEKAAFAFDLVDENGDGKITVDELRRCLRAMNTALSGLEQQAAQTDAEIEEVIKATFEADHNHDGVLTIDEFIDAVRVHPRLLDFEKILSRPKAEEFQHLHYMVCLDGSDYADRAFEQVYMTLDKCCRMTLVYVHAPADPARRPPMMPHQRYEAQHEAYLKKMQMFLDRYRDRALGRELKCDVIVERGDPPTILCQLGSRLCADVVVCGAHGRWHSSGVRGVAPGKVAKALFNTCSSSILIVK